ncbi:hypothetical protein BCP78_0134 [Bacillus phage BCP78]|uniref:Uncharacterized protein n=2 Tax=Tsarbombavirus BCP78 TaxID=1985182 RepID=J9PRY8_9CAUD|nr:hypothetical protein BCP78_0134 [Bacillus phage BCP78]YP_009783497.1 hypothetical protein QLX27_gp124 [Bacillus phage BCU4]AEW47141.1 hypothetical protein BCP78_0134 [Bacillus phage BCP78]AEW47630.1 hypothetical protein BCU4_0124 [Bacillus phage BCU4]
MHQMSREELINISGSDLAYHRKGVLLVDNKPHYIVELVKEPHTALYAAVYAVHPGTDKYPKKRAMQKEGFVGRFNGTTRLAQIANALFPAKRVIGWEEEPPLFVAPIVSGQISTFTKQVEDGFFEREPDRLTTEGGERKIIRGKNTGVFIGLSSIEWEEKTSIPLDSLVKALINHNQNDGFFDLTGDNNSKNNPLGTYYKEGK